MSDKKVIVLAIGGNSLIKDNAHQTVPDQYGTTEETCGAIVKLLEQGHRVVITHGNGPQVGFILRRTELAAHELHRVPLDSCGADTQGAIGYNLQMGLYNQMRGWAKRIPAATVVTQVVVDKADPAFLNPAKPIGSFMNEATAREHELKDGWTVVEDAGRGFRRVVPSPKPQEILEIDIIKSMIAQGYVVIAVGGGGIPVAIEADGRLVGIEAVIDKDHASSLLARLIDANVLLISTAVEKAAKNFGKPNQAVIERMTVAEAKAAIEEKHFAAGSMLPKIQAMIAFVEATGGEAILTDPPNLMRAVAGETGTRIVP